MANLRLISEFSISQPVLVSMMSFPLFCPFAMDPLWPEPPASVGNGVTCAGIRNELFGNILSHIHTTDRKQKFGFQSRQRQSATINAAYFITQKGRSHILK
mmetsp:Transcript_40588/g.98025  ORF Transcript_40588/g.98025 Transcript_40588/m.98025 type:complete len:101 (-) Transcript_40588:884-1186(-)